MTSPAATRVLVVDDDGDLRRLVAASLAAHPTLTLVAEAVDGTSALALCAEHHPGIIVLDLGLPDISGRDLLSRIRTGAPWVRVVVFTGSDTPTATARRWGASRVVRKDESVRRLIAVLERIADEPLVARLELFASTAVVARARRFVQETLGNWGLERIAADAQLVVSELVTNAVVHAGSPSDLRVVAKPGVLRIEVGDDAQASPEPQEVHDAGPGGRGLLIVSALSLAWGIDPRNGGKVVWAELAA
jgi:CheY-like chemotaxis protein/anti-sigma regulatory factor (Ser/Thr protein kinase)